MLLRPRVMNSAVLIVLMDGDVHEDDVMIECAVLHDATDSTVRHALNRLRKAHLCEVQKRVWNRTDEGRAEAVEHWQFFKELLGEV